MKIGKCTNCGATIEVNETEEAGICRYCGSAYITEKAIANINSTTNNATVINNYYTNPTQNENKTVYTYQVPPRPKVNIILAVLGLMVYLFPGIIYIGYIKAKQEEWDDKYNSNKF